MDIALEGDEKNEKDMDVAIKVLVVIVMVRDACAESETYESRPRMIIVVLSTMWRVQRALKRLQ